MGRTMSSIMVEKPEASRHAVRFLSKMANLCLASKSLYAVDKPGGICVSFSFYSECLCPIGKANISLSLHEFSFEVDP